MLPLLTIAAIAWDQFAVRRALHGLKLDFRFLVGADWRLLQNDQRLRAVGSIDLAFEFHGLHASLFARGLR